MKKVSPIGMNIAVAKVVKAPKVGHAPMTGDNHGHAPMSSTTMLGHKPMQGA